MTDAQRRTLFHPDPAVEAVKPVVVAPPQVAPIVDAPPTAEEPVIEELAPRRANPWLLGLWAWAVVLIVGGVWAYVSSIGAQYQGYSGSMDDAFWLTSEFAISTLKVTFAPGVFAVGLASAVAATAISAVQWMRRHP